MQSNRDPFVCLRVYFMSVHFISVCVCVYENVFCRQRQRRLRTRAMTNCEATLTPQKRTIYLPKNHLRVAAGLP